ncbi:MAG: hypothetical protein ACRELX_06775, partial [Longimicrobiales bacterium]
VSAFSYGLAVWDPGTSEFTNPPASPIHPGGVASIAGIGLDAEDRLYALEPNCTGPGSALRLDAAFEVEIEIETGICPVAVVFTEVGT